MNWKRPLGLMPLIMVFSTLVILTTMLATMVWSRISLLQNGTQIVLKTAPIDPRDLLRGYYVRLGYDISRITLSELPVPMSESELGGGFKKRSVIYVKLQSDQDGFWSPLSVHRVRPKSDKNTDPQTIFIRGRLLYGSCTRGSRSIDDCKISIRYGIEKFFAQKKRARKLEDFGRQSSPEITALRAELDELQNVYSRSVRIKNRPLEAQPDVRNNAHNKQMREKLAKMRRKLGELRQQRRVKIAKRFAVIVRVDKHSGEAAISGLQLDGRRIYDERLF